MNLNNLNVHLYSRDSTMKLVQYSNGKCVDSQMDQIFYIMLLSDENNPKNGHDTDKC